MWVLYLSTAVNMVASRWSNILWKFLDVVVIEIIDDMSLDMSLNLSLLSRAFETPFLLNFTGIVLKTDPLSTFRSFAFLYLEIPPIS